MEKLTPEKLIEVLQQLVGKNVCLVKNQVGNLSINDQVGDYIGYIDLLNGEIDFWGDSEELKRVWNRGRETK